MSAWKHPEVLARIIDKPWFEKYDHDPRNYLIIACVEGEKQITWAKRCRKCGKFYDPTKSMLDLTDCGVRRG